MRRLQLCRAFRACNVLITAALLTAFAAAAPAAYADFVVELEGPNNLDYRIEDNGLGDTNQAPGIIGVLIDDATEEIVLTAITYGGEDGSDEWPGLNLNVNFMFVTGKWTIRVTDTDWDNDASMGRARVRGGVVGSSGIDFKFGGDSGNSEFDLDFVMATTSFEANRFSQRKEVTGNADAVGSLTMEVVVKKGDGDDTDANASFIADYQVEIAGGGGNPGGGGEDNPDAPENGIISFPEQGTIGTVIEFSGAGFGTKKNKVYAEYVDKKGKTKKKNLKVLAWSDTEIRAQWKVKTAPQDCALFVQPKKSDPRDAGPFRLKAPESLDIARDVAEPKDEVTLSGLFLGDKQATPKLKFTYVNRKGKTVSKNVKILKKTIAFDQTTGDGGFTFQVPKLSKKDLPAEGTLTFKNKIGEAVVGDTLTIVDEFDDQNI